MDTHRHTEGDGVPPQNKMGGRSLDKGRKKENETYLWKWLSNVFLQAVSSEESCLPIIKTGRMVEKCLPASKESRQWSSAVKVCECFKLSARSRCKRHCKWWSFFLSVQMKQTNKRTTASVSQSRFVPFHLQLINFFVCCSFVAVQADKLELRVRCRGRLIEGCGRSKCTVVLGWHARKTMQG